MTIKPWREIAEPHQDVLEGTFRQSEFAADISQVANGTAPDEYQNPEKFFARTFITEGMELLLTSVAQRLSGLGGDPVIQLQTSFGGGKTHTMLAVYHLSEGQVSTDKLEGIPTLLDKAGITNLPVAKIAVIDGITMAANEGKQHDDIIIYTLWGELAWQLAGKTGYQLVENSDKNGTSPGKDTLIKLLQHASPCVILMDELQKFFSELQPGRTLSAGSYEANIKFIQALTEAVKTVPNAILLASLPESQSEVGDAFGQSALDALEKHFGRLESVWKPVATEEAFEIVRRRLFKNSGNRQEIEKVCNAFYEFYRANPNNFPEEVQTIDYKDRMVNAYPIHPEIFDRLYEDWSTLDKFQRTRGVLQYMAVLIHRLWVDGNKDILIMPGSLPLSDTNVCNKSIHYLPQGWQPVIEKEVDGPRSQTHNIDTNDIRFGSVQAAHRIMRTIFLDTAPSGLTQQHKGVDKKRIFLGAIQPEQNLGIFDDVLKRLRDQLHYLYIENDRFWLETKPNLRREMEGRKNNIDGLALIGEIRQRLQQLFGGNSNFSGVHVFSSSADIPDEYGNAPRLVILPLEANYNRTKDTPAFSHANNILQNRGEQQRIKRNRLLFLAPDNDVLGRLKDDVRTYLAWRGIIRDIDNGTLNLDNHQSRLARSSRENSEKTLNQVIKECYKWLLCPVQSSTSNEVEWETVALSTSSNNLQQEIALKIAEQEWVINQWSPIHLNNILMQWYFKNGVKEIPLQKVWDDICNYIYLPRLQNRMVLENTVTTGLKQGDYFGFAAGIENDKYLGFHFNDSNTTPSLDFYSEQSILIEKSKANDYRQSLVKPKSDIEQGPQDTGVQINPDPTGPKDQTGNGSGTNVSGGNSPKPSPTINKKFTGIVNIDPNKAKADFSRIFEEIIQNFLYESDVDIEITLEIEAKTKDGFDENLQRSINSNGKQLKFKTVEFEKDNE